MAQLYLQANLESLFAQLAAAAQGALLLDYGGTLQHRARTCQGGCIL